MKKKPYSYEADWRQYAFPPQTSGFADEELLEEYLTNLFGAGYSVELALEKGSTTEIMNLVNDDGEIEEVACTYTTYGLKIIAL